MSPLHRLLPAAAVVAALALPAAASATPFVYVGTTNGVSPFNAPLAGAFTALTAPAASGTNEIFVAAAPDGRTLYSSSGTTTVNQYRVNGADGTLRPLGASDPAPGAVIGRLSTSPDGLNVYATSQNSGLVSQWGIDQVTGRLTFQANYSVPGAGQNGPTDAAVTPNGQFVVVSPGNNGLALVFARNPTTGGLTPVAQTGGNGNTGTGSVAAISSNGTDVYFATTNQDRIYQFTLTAGQLVPKSPAFVGSTQGAPLFPVVSPDGKNLYQPNVGGTPGIDVFTIDQTTGNLTFDQRVNTGGGSYSAAVTPDGTAVFNVQQSTNQVTKFTRSTTTGRLSSPSTLGTRANPNGVIVVGSVASTAVRWAGGTATAKRNGVRIAWRTGRETDNLGFDVYRVRRGASRVKLTRTLIKGGALRSGKTSYALTDRGGRRGDRYLVVARGLDGKRAVHVVVAR